MKIANLVSGIPVVVLGALMLVEGILVYTSDAGFWLGNTSPNLSLALGVIALLVGGTLMEEARH
ncbi:MAG: hypothetical protein ACE5JE_08795 [Thermoplasmata archaeon]